MATALLAGCVFSANTLAQSPPDVTLARLDALDWQGDHALLTVALDVRNPNSVALPLQSLRFHCLLAAVPLAEGTSTTPVLIAANGHTIIVVRLEVDAAAVLALASRLSSANLLPYTINGVAELGLTGVPVAFSRSGTVSLAR